MRRVITGLMARQAIDVEQLKFSTGASWTAKPGDWIITLGTELLEVVNARDFPSRFAFIEEGMVLPRTICSKIEVITGMGTTQTPDKLYEGIDRLAHIAIGGINIEFTPGQLEEIKHRAHKRGYTVEQELQRIIDRIKDEIFHHS